MIRLTGQERFQCSPEDLWPKLSDPQFLCGCFPGVEAVQEADDRSATFRVRPGFSFLRGTLEVRLEVVDAQPHQQARAVLHVRGIGSSVEVTTWLGLSTVDEGTQVDWSLEATQVGGLLGAVSPGLIEAAAGRVAKDTWDAIRQRLE